MSEDFEIETQRVASFMNLDQAQQLNDKWLNQNLLRFLAKHGMPDREANLVASLAALGMIAVCDVHMEQEA